MALPVIATWLTACLPSAGPSSDERLEEGASGAKGDNGSLSRAQTDLSSRRCSEVKEKLTRARSEERPEAERLLSYQESYKELKERVEALEAVVARNPDLQYREGGENVEQVLEECNTLIADVRQEFERFIREIFDLLVVQEVRGGRRVDVARIDFRKLREAVEVLAPNDRDVLIAQLEAAEKRIPGRKGD